MLSFYSLTILFASHKQKRTTQEILDLSNDLRLVPKQILDLIKKHDALSKEIAHMFVERWNQRGRRIEFYLRHFRGIDDLTPGLALCLSRLGFVDHDPADSRDPSILCRRSLGKKSQTLWC